MAKGGDTTTSETTGELPAYIKPYVTDILAKEGDEVQAGQPLIRLSYERGTVSGATSGVGLEGKPSMAKVPPNASITLSTLAKRKVGFPASKSTMKRTPTPAAIANWGCVRPKRLRAARRVSPSSWVLWMLTMVDLISRSVNY